MELTVQNVFGLLLRSKLLPVEEAKAMFARWQQDAGDKVGNLVQFANWMVNHNYVTEYQASLLARGHAEGFFLNEYMILDRLGKGRMAGVYKARHELGQIVAIKVLPPSKARDAGMLGRFRREAKLSLRLRHPNIVRSFQVGLAGNLHYLVMEHLDGETLEDLLNKRKIFTAPEAVRIIYQTLQGLQHIHEQNLVHRDLKPSNLMLVPAPGSGSVLNSTVKILDIGLGRALFEEGIDVPDAGLTGEGVLLGTPDYMAPEQARDPRQSDIRADIYSLGCVLYHLLTGQPPFPDTNIISQMIRHASEQARPVAELNPSVPDGLQQILNWMMAKDPAGRYPTPIRAAQALEVFLAAGSTPASSPDLDPEMKPYLNWLEHEKDRKPASKPAGGSAAVEQTPTIPALTVPEKSSTGKPSSGTIPTQAEVKEKPRSPIPLKRKDALEEESSPKEGEKSTPQLRKKKRPPPALPSPVTSQPVPAVETVDVELVSLPEKSAESSNFLVNLSRRDFILFFAGVGSGLIAYFIGVGLAALIRSIRYRDPAPENLEPDN